MSKEFKSKKGLVNFTFSWYSLFATLITIGIIALLMSTIPHLPPFGHPDNPPNNEVAQRYVEKGTEETGVINTVAGMILNYRGFDTFGEATILYVAVEGVMFLMRKKYNPELEEDDNNEINEG